MNLEKYIELTGEMVTPTQEPKVKAAIRRTKTQLETMLGYSLNPKNLYTELGKVRFEGFIPLVNDVDRLLPPDEEEGTYKLFSYNDADRYFHVDPFKNIYHVKLVKPINDGEFITVTDLDNVVAKYERDGIGRFIERHYEWFTWQWYLTYLLRYGSVSDAGLMLAVNADWLDCYPQDIMYLWADMITYQTSPQLGLSSESVDGRSWSRTKEAQVQPQDLPVNRKLLSRYVGPNGSLARIPVR